MNGKKRIVLWALLAAMLAAHIPAQTNDTSNEFDTTGFPSWVKDVRRWEIVAFGSIPFTMFTATFAMDMYRWSKANNLDFSNEGRRYAPWPLKSAGAIAMESAEMERTLIIAGSLSIAIAIADQIIVQVKRRNEQKRVEALPVGTAVITRNPWYEEPHEEPSAIDEDILLEPDIPGEQL